MKAEIAVRPVEGVATLTLSYKEAEALRLIGAYAHTRAWNTFYNLNKKELLPVLLDLAQYFAGVSRA